MEIMSDEKLKVGAGRLSVNYPLKKGYKLTEVGLIPVEWKVIALKDVSDVVRGGSPRPAGDARYFNGKYIPWLTVASLTNIPDSQLFVSETANSLTEEGSKRSRILDNETVIISNSGATLGVAKLLSIKCCANDGIAALLNVVNCNKLFICYFLNSKTRYFREIVATGNGQPNLNTTLIGSTFIPYPPLSEQKSIAETLNDVDALISSLDILITKKRNVKQGAMQQLLSGKKRLADYIELWKIVNIDEIAEVKGGKRLPKGKSLSDFETSYPYIKVADMFQGGVSLKEIQYVPADVYPLIKEYRIYKNDLFISVAGTLGIVGKIPDILDGANLTENADKLTNIRCNKDYLLLILMSPCFQKYIESEKTMGAQPKLALTRIKKFPIPLPSHSEQQAIAQTIGDINAEIECLEQQRDKIKFVKKGMMQELLTGKTRLI